MPDPVPDRPNATPEHLLASDREAGFDLTDDFERFDQMNDTFTRAFWDDSLRSKDTDAFFASYREAPSARRAEGVGPRDFALRNAAWALSDVISNRGGAEGVREGFQGQIRDDTPVARTKAVLGTPEEEAKDIKRIAAFFGADLCGITEFDSRWHYSRVPDTRTMTPRPPDLPEGLSHVIVMGHAMDFDLVETYPSALAGAATGREYSHEAAIVIQLAAYIRGLGYRAVASMNDTALVIPYAIKAGLGDYGRNQMVLTPEFGPRVRFSKIFTDMPLAVDRPRQHGMGAYCTDCTRCAAACPPRALPFGPPDLGAGSPSTVRGVRKWSANCEACFGYWAKLKSDCAICMRVCPFNAPRDSLGHRLWYRLATSRFRRLARWWVDRKGPRPRLRPGQWWGNAANAKGSGHRR